MAEQKKLLVIEDDMFLRELCLDKFQNSQYQVEFASDGKTGLDLLLQNTYDLVLLDIMLPEMDGFELLSRYQDIHTKSDRPRILVLSNLSEQEHIDKAMALGAHEYIIKAHHSPTEIVTKVNELLAQ